MRIIRSFSSNAGDKRTVSRSFLFAFFGFPAVGYFLGRVRCSSNVMSSLSFIVFIPVLWFNLL